MNKTTINNTNTMSTISSINETISTELKSPTKKVNFNLHQHREASQEATHLTTDFMKLREAQVIEMIAGRKLPTKNGSAQPEYPQPSAETKMKWMERHPSYHTFTSKYMASQKRILFLADIEPHLRFESFEKLCYERSVAPTTAEGYWTTWLSVQKALSIRASNSDARVSKLLKARSVAYPVAFPAPATMSDICSLTTLFFNEHPSITTIVAIAFLNGQRISDMIQLGTADLVFDDEFLMITVRRGKTISVTSHPYTLWMRRNSTVVETMITMKKNAGTRLFLLSLFNSEVERDRILDTVRQMLLSVNEELELRSIRRGGLQRMAQLGFSMDTILEFSRHSGVPMLMRYLNWGEHSTHRRGQMIDVIDATSSGMEMMDPAVETKKQL